MNPRAEIIALLRGQVACPVIACLGELGWLGRMCEQSFDLSSFGTSVDARMFNIVMTYLASLSLITRDSEANSFRATEIGKSVFRRYGAFCILNSYEEYLRNLAAELVQTDMPPPQVARRRNIVGSGALHDKKFFAPALELVRKNSYGCIADIGCGNGQFLLSCAALYPTARLLGVDLSPIAVKETVQRLSGCASHSRIFGLVADGADIAGWGQSLVMHVTQENCRPEQVLICLWFLVHEISKADIQVVIDFFRGIHRFCPGATVLLGELVRLSEETLAPSRSVSILPELTLLHDLSHQGLLGWDDWRIIAREIPYTIAGERHFDLAPTPHGGKHPSSFVWLLTSHPSCS